MIESKILQSIVEITKQRDLDSMESSLVATLAELLPIVGVCILKTIERSNLTCAEEVVCLSIDHDKEDPYAWRFDSAIITTNDHFIDCLSHSKIISYKHEDGFSRHLFPINDELQSMACLVIDSHEDLSSHLSFIKGFAKIYENYMIVFNESERDKLTGLFNRRTFDNKLIKLFKKQRGQSEINSTSSETNRRQIESARSAWLIIADIDHFKRVNDNYGHVFGDEVILTISQKMKSCFRSSDLLFRIGGEEFVILLEPAPQEVAEKLIQNFLKTIENHAFAQIGTITVSAGYTRISEKDYPPAILECADRALYYAKEQGRNCAFNYEALIDSDKIASANKSGSIDLF